jgi:hypothetical protein
MLHLQSEFVTPRCNDFVPDLFFNLITMGFQHQEININQFLIYQIDKALLIFYYYSLPNSAW